MISRPFAIIHQPCLQGLEIRVDLEAPGAEQLQTLQNALESFIRIGALGGLSGARISPAESALHLAKSQCYGDRTMVWGFDEVRIDPGSLMIAINLIHHYHLTVAPVAKMVFLNTDHDEIQHLHGHYEPLPFDYKNEVIDVETLIEASFANPIENNLTEQYEEALEAWLRTGILGGFADEIYTPEETGLSPNEIRSCPIEMSVALDNVMISDHAYDILINIFYRLHHKIAKISSVIIH